MTSLESVPLTISDCQYFFCLPKVWSMLYPGPVESLKNPILYFSFYTNHKEELVMENCQWNCMLYVETHQVICVFYPCNFHLVFALITCKACVLFASYGFFVFLLASSLLLRILQRFSRNFHACYLQKRLQLFVSL